MGSEILTRLLCDLTAYSRVRNGLVAGRVMDFEGDDGLRVDLR